MCLSTRNGATYTRGRPREAAHMKGTEILQPKTVQGRMGIMLGLLYWAVRWWWCFKSAVGDVVSGENFLWVRRGLGLSKARDRKSVV